MPYIYCCLKFRPEVGITSPSPFQECPLPRIITEMPGSRERTHEAAFGLQEVHSFSIWVLQENKRFLSLIFLQLLQQITSSNYFQSLEPEIPAAVAFFQNEHLWSKSCTITKLPNLPKKLWSWKTYISD